MDCGEEEEIRELYLLKERALPYKAERASPGKSEPSPLERAG
jgi:hypothetical protein